MLFPETYPAALGLTILTMICWGSWANTLKLCPGYRFQLFYWDYVLGMAAGAVLWGLTAGSIGSAGTPFLADLKQTAAGPMLYAIAGGAIFNVANLLLVAAIDVAGLAVAFPVGIGLALVIGAVSNYVLKPVGNPLLLFGGVALVVVAIVLDAAAYRKREATAKATTGRGIFISLACGVLMGCFYPFVAHALNGEPGSAAPGPYAVTMFFMIGVLISAVPANWLLMKKPLDGKEPVDGAATGARLWAGIWLERWEEPSGARAAWRISSRRVRIWWGQQFLIALVRAQPWSPPAGAFLCGTSLPALRDRPRHFWF